MTYFFPISCPIETHSLTEIYSNGLFYFAQKTLPLLLAAVDSSPHPPSLLVTGATASLRGSAFFSTFAAGKFAQRAITQSLAREFGPKGVHVALAVIDGGIDTPWGKDRVVNNGVEDGKINPDAVCFVTNPLFIIQQMANKGYADCRKLLALTHTTQIIFHSRIGYPPICGEILDNYSVCDIINIINTSTNTLDRYFLKLRVCQKESLEGDQKSVIRHLQHQCRKAVS